MGSALVLASASPRRRDLLREHGFTFSIDPAQVKEQTPPYLTTAETVFWNGCAKAFAVARRHPRSVVLGADTLVSLDGRPLGKPMSIEEAFAMLSQLSGRAHEVFSGVCLVRLWPRRATTGFIEKSVVRFRPISAKEIQSYLTQIDPFDKAGGYAAQDDRHGLVESIDGSRANVIGLPMERLISVLREWLSVPFVSAAER